MFFVCLQNTDLSNFFIPSGSLIDPSSPTYLLLSRAGVPMQPFAEELRASVKQALNGREGSESDVLAALIGLASLPPTGSGSGEGEFWIDPASGNDANPGTKTKPMKTMARALATIGLNVTGVADIHLLPHPDPDGYNEEEFWIPRLISNRLRFFGEGVIEDFPAIAIDSLNDQEYVFTTAAPGWTPGEHAGKTLEVVTSANGIRVGQPRMILWNTADRLIMAAIHARYPDFAGVTAGDTFRIVRPSVAINCAPRSSDLLARHLVGGVAISGVDGLFRPFVSQLVLQNLNLRMPSNTAFDMFASGNIELYGVELTSDVTGSAPEIIFNNSVTRAGPFLDAAVVSEFNYGWGLNTRTRTAGRARPGVRFSNSEADMYYSGGRLIVERGTEYRWQSGCVDMSNWTESEDGLLVRVARLITNGNSRNNNVFFTDAGGYDMVSSLAKVEWTAPVRHLGTGAVFRCEENGYVLFTKQEIMDGSTPAIASGNESNARTGGKVEIRGNSATNLGDVSCGVFSKTTRASAAWVAGNAVDGEMSSHIMRTS